ncbi:hypothetical protein OG756_41375 [Streptomyces sp. NBC_01310]|uniref:hypothetical protein n=1 Tax=Streptomyces sp. NBC_01310 TaxID=2903820 RepID=UPI0035B58328|nr:hypothetical protein OG756_00010 [Streptomyces sp. NBC_01310]WSJ63855.1 hypothetical protein OG756_41375 [Streptomyces sp. NBC_01310]
MPVYEYHPDELAQISVVRQAHGLDLDAVKAQWHAAREREEHAFAAPPEAGRLTALDIASWQHIEWARIARVMAELQMAVYAPDEDPRVVRREEQRAQRMDTEATWDEQAGSIQPVEVRRHRIYRITARPAAAGEPPLIRHIFAASASAAVEHAHALFRRPRSIYQDGEYRITSVEQVLPESGDFF